MKPLGFRGIEQKRKIPYIDFNVDGSLRTAIYFNTGYVPGTKTGIEVALGRYTERNIEHGWHIGCRSGWVRNAFQICINNYEIFDPWYAWNSDANTTWPGEGRGQEWQQINVAEIKPNGNFYTNGKLIASCNTPLTSSGCPIYIGDVNENGQPVAITASQGQLRFYWFNIYENGLKVRHYVPILDGSVVKIIETISGEKLEQMKVGNSTVRYGEEFLTSTYPPPDGSALLTIAVPFYEEFLEVAA